MGAPTAVGLIFDTVFLEFVKDSIARKRPWRVPSIEGNAEQPLKIRRTAAPPMPLSHRGIGD